MTETNNDPRAADESRTAFQEARAESFAGLLSIPVMLIAYGCAAAGVTWGPLVLGMGGLVLMAFALPGPPEHVGFRLTVASIKIVPLLPLSMAASYVAVQEDLFTSSVGFVSLTLALIAGVALVPVVGVLFVGSWLVLNLLERYAAPTLRGRPSPWGHRAALTASTLVLVSSVLWSIKSPSPSGYVASLRRIGDVGGVGGRRDALPVHADGATVNVTGPFPTYKAGTMAYEERCRVEVKSSAGWSDIWSSGTRACSLVVRSAPVLLSIYRRTREVCIWWS